MSGIWFVRVSWIPAGAANFSRSFLFTVGFKAFSICFGRFSVPVFRTGSNGICPLNIWIFFAPRCGARKIWRYSLLSTHPFGGVAIGLLLELSDAEHYTGTWSLAYICSSKALNRSLHTTFALRLDLFVLSIRLMRSRCRERMLPG